VKLSEERIAERLKGLEGWKRDDAKWISAKFRFAAFMDAVDFVNEVARTAEAMNHHPMIAIDYKMVTLRLTTWHAGGLTEADFDAAEAYNRSYARFRKPRDGEKPKV